MKDYLALCERVLNHGVWVPNARTGVNCLTAVNADLTYDARNNAFPLITTRKVPWKSAIAEMLGYLRGYDSAAQFRALGCKTWDANANKNTKWLTNPYRKGDDDMGRCYGPQIRQWQKPSNGGFVDQLYQVYSDLQHGHDNRCEIIALYNPGEKERGCLNPCVHTYTFSILDGTLYLTAYQRSDDLPLGHVFNQIQMVWFLRVMAQITGLEAGAVFHKIVNAHIYENQVSLMREQIQRRPFKSPTLHINPDIRTLEDLCDWVTLDDFHVTGYAHHDAIDYPFTV